MKHLSMPNFLQPVFKVWMAFSELLGWIMTHVILIALFYVILTPIALVARVLFRKKFLETRFRDSEKSYWCEREQSEFRARDYEQQF